MIKCLKVIKIEIYWEFLQEITISLQGVKFDKLRS